MRARMVPQVLSAGYGVWVGCVVQPTDSVLLLAL
jgi:hypothetical protein